MPMDMNRFRPWLMLLARTRLDEALRGKVEASDIVQQTLMLATRDFEQFRGSTDAEFAGWLRGILGHVLAHELRHVSTEKRDVTLEVSLDELLVASSRRLDDFLAASQTSPSQAAVRSEDQLRLAAALEELPADYRDVLVLRHLEGFAFSEIALRMNRNIGAVRMLWVRALEKLRAALLIPERCDTPSK